MAYPVPRAETKNLVAAEPGWHVVTVRTDPLRRVAASIVKIQEVTHWWDERPVSNGMRLYFDPDNFGMATLIQYLMDPLGHFWGRSLYDGTGRRQFYGNSLHEMNEAYTKARADEA